jgi:hypothetical protein
VTVIVEYSRLDDELNSAQVELHVGPQFREQAFAVFLSSSGRWHFLYFLPLPHQQGSFLPGISAGALSSLLFNKLIARSNSPISPPAKQGFQVVIVPK